MRTVLIIYPHWPPSNLVGVHRVRLIANNLTQNGWHPLVLTIHEDDYEEPPSPELNQLVSKDVEVIKARARKPISLLGKRLIGDIGLRGFFSLKNAAYQLCEERQIDFAWFSIPSWYPPLLGRGLRKKYHVHFGIDYQDPWVFPLPEGTPIISRAQLSQWASRILEPIALKHCHLITGINTAYFQGAINRNQHKKNTAVADFQLGFDPDDHNKEVEATPPWDSRKRVILYPGAYLPLSAPFYRGLFSAIQQLIEEGKWPKDVLLAFIGTSRTDRPIHALAQEFNCSETIIEIPQRLPFLEVQQHLRTVLGSMVIGSPEPHYSASKVFQCILCKRPILAILHQQSEAMSILRSCQADTYSIGYHADNAMFAAEIKEKLFLLILNEGKDWNPDISQLQPFHASKASRKLARAMESVLS